jgi:hypothetical protein
VGEVNKNFFSQAKDVVQWHSTCSACIKALNFIPNTTKKKSSGRSPSNHNPLTRLQARYGQRPQWQPFHGTWLSPNSLGLQGVHTALPSMSPSGSCITCLHCCLPVPGKQRSDTAGNHYQEKAATKVSLKCDLPLLSNRMRLN